jgi:hypothetical protein
MELQNLSVRFWLQQTPHVKTYMQFSLQQTLHVKTYMQFWLQQTLHVKTYVLAVLRASQGNSLDIYQSDSCRQLH